MQTARPRLHTCSSSRVLFEGDLHLLGIPESCQGSRHVWSLQVKEKQKHGDTAPASEAIPDIGGSAPISAQKNLYCIPVAQVGCYPVMHKGLEDVLRAHCSLRGRISVETESLPLLLCGITK